MKASCWPMCCQPLKASWYLIASHLRQAMISIASQQRQAYGKLTFSQPLKASLAWKGSNLVKLCQPIKASNGWIASHLRQAWLYKYFSSQSRQADAVMVPVPSTAALLREAAYEDRVVQKLHREQCKWAPLAPLLCSSNHQVLATSKHGLLFRKHPLHSALIDLKLLF